MELKVIPNHQNYAITESGAVYRILSPGLYSSLIPDLSNGYPRVDLDGKKEYIARLVLETFQPQPYKSWKVFYIDGNSFNTNLSNLVWLSPSDIQIYSTYTIERRKELFGR